MMRKTILMIIGLCLILAPVMFAVNSTSAKVIEITVSDHNPEMAPPARAMGYWAQKVNEQLAGKAKITVHHGGALLKGNEAYRGVQRGVAAAAHYILDRRDGFFLNTIMTLPFMGWPDQQKTGQIYNQLIAKFPQMKKEWQGVIPYVFAMMPPTQIHCVNKAIKTPADLKGLKFHGSETGVVQTLDAAGATPVQLDIADMYMSLDRGLIEGVMNHFPVLGVFGVLKLLKYHTILGDGGINMTPMGIIWNEEQWNKLPADVRKVLTDSIHFYLEKFYELDAGFMAKVVGDAKSWKHDFTYLTPDQVKTWYDLVKGPIHDQWIQQAEAKKLPGKAVYTETLKLIKQAK